jgi:Trk-type K+ transport system membrane component
MVLAQIGGFGLMAFSSVVAVALAGKLELRHRLATQAEVNLAGGADFKAVILGVFRWSIGIEAAVAVALFGGFVVIYGEPLGKRPGWGCSMRSPRSTTQGSPCSVTTWSASSTIHGSRG